MGLIGGSRPEGNVATQLNCTSCRTATCANADAGLTVSLYCIVYMLDMSIHANIINNSYVFQNRTIVMLNVLKGCFDCSVILIQFPCS